MPAPHWLSFVKFNYYLAVIDIGTEGPLGCLA